MDDQLFNIPRNTIESQSTVIRDMLAEADPDENLGADDDNPIILSKITSDEFVVFLDVLGCVQSMVMYAWPLTDRQR